MRKFLKLIRESRPREDTYTVELKDVTGNVLRRFAISGVGSPFENFLAFEDSVGGVEVPAPVEDQESLTDIDAAVVAQAAADPAGPAAVALKDRQAAAESIIATFMADTEQMKQAASGKGGSPAVVGGGGSFGSSQ